MFPGRCILNSYFENSLIEIQFLEPFRREGNSLLLRIIAGVGVESILTTRNAADKDVGLQSRDPTSFSSGSGSGFAEDAVIKSYMGVTT
jgi:hypothetical protein